jgi:hypothetical protein
MVNSLERSAGFRVSYRSPKALFYRHQNTSSAKSPRELQGRREHCVVPRRQPSVWRIVLVHSIGGAFAVEFGPEADVIGSAGAVASGSQ